MRITARLTLVLAVLLAASAVVVVLWHSGATDPAAWATVAAALAVLTSVVSSWTAQRLLELEEDRQRPQPNLRFDLESRANLLLLRLTNSGGSPAFSVSIEWKKPALMIHADIPHGAREAHFSEQQPEIQILQPGESLALAIASSTDFLAAPPCVYSGTISFKDGAGRKDAVEFSLSAEHHRFALRYTTEDLMSQKKLQEIPTDLKRIAKALESGGGNLR